MSDQQQTSGAARVAPTAGEPSESMEGALVEWEFDTRLPTEDEPQMRPWYDLTGEQPYSFMEILERFYRAGRRVRVTVEDAGPDQTSPVTIAAAARMTAQDIAERRGDVLADQTPKPFGTRREWF